MPNQFKCNDSKSGPADKINSFNAVYDYYYDNVIRNKKGDSLFVNPTGSNYPNVPEGQTWNSAFCDSMGCPGNATKEIIFNSFYFNNDKDQGISIKNSDLAIYLDDCASKINLDTSSPNYGNNGNYDYSKTMILRDISYNNLLNDRSDLDRKMKEVLSLQGAMVNEHQNYVDGSVYTTMLWTVMATSLIYYVFTKI